MFDFEDLFFVNKNKQFLSHFLGWNLEKFMQFEGWGMSQAAFSNLVFTENQPLHRYPQPTFTCSNSTVEKVEKVVKFVQSSQ